MTDTKPDRFRATLAESPAPTLPDPEVSLKLLLGRLDFATWAELGIRKGWCGPPVCEPHDGLPTTEAEDNDMMDGGDPCIHIIRLYPDDYTKAGVEANHAPTVWRASNAGYETHSETPPLRD